MVTIILGLYSLHSIILDVSQMEGVAFNFELTYIILLFFLLTKYTHNFTPFSTF
jgi:hypothetical protein